MKVFTLFICFFSVCIAHSQNLVPNPSFEDTVSCPTISSSINQAENWQLYSSSPDYYNTCVQSPYFGNGVPFNYAGFQYPASGNAYAGFYSYVNEIGYSNREILGTNLLVPMAIGTKYFISFKTVLTPYTINIGCSLANNKLGVLFSTLPFSNFDSTTIPPIQNFAHIWTDSIITDTVNWTTVFGSFIADSTYSYISLGNFFSNNYTDTLCLTNSSGYNCAYYLIDDICVSTDSLFCENYIYSGINEKYLLNNFSIYPNPAIDYILITQSMSSPYDINIYNDIGQLIYIENNVTTTVNKIDISEFNKGLFLVNIFFNNQNKIYKLLKL